MAVLNNELCPQLASEHLPQITATQKHETYPQITQRSRAVTKTMLLFASTLPPVVRRGSAAPYTSRKSLRAAKPRVGRITGIATAGPSHASQQAASRFETFVKA